MVEQELITKIKRIGVESGVIEIFYASSDPTIFIEFFDENTGIDHTLEWIQLGKLSHIKESFVIGDIDLGNIKTSSEKEEAIRLLQQQGKEMEPNLIKKAKEYAKEITERAGIPVEVVDELQGEPGLMTVHDQNMWHAGEVLRGIDDDY